MFRATLSPRAKESLLYHLNGGADVSGYGHAWADHDIIVVDEIFEGSPKSPEDSKFWWSTRPAGMTKWEPTDSTAVAEKAEVAGWVLTIQFPGGDISKAITRFDVDPSMMKIDGLSISATGKTFMVSVDL